MPPRDESRIPQLFERLESQLPKEDVRARNTLAALRQEFTASGANAAELEEKLAEFEEAYKKLTRPANRAGVFLRWLDAEEAKEAVEGQEAPAEAERYALVLVGESEYVVSLDPAVDQDRLVLGTRLRVNEAFAVVGILPPSDGGSLISVQDAMEDGRLRVGGTTPGADGGRLVLRSEALKETKVRSGDEVRLDGTGRVAVEHFEKKESRDYFLEDVPQIPWEEIGGQKEAIGLIRETIELPLLNPEVFERFEKKPIKGVLLYGPPGCGKTLIGKAVAYNLAQEYSKQKGEEVKEYFMAISGPKILNMWLGETERMVREIFATAREKAKDGHLVFIFMDEAESVLRTRSTGRYLNISNTVVPQFCAELDGLQSLDNVVLMLTSNRPDYIDPAVLRPGRIDRKVKVVRPDKDATREILRIYLNDRLPIDPETLERYQGEHECARKELVDGLTDELWRATKETEFLKVSHRNGKDETLYFRDMMSGAILENIVDRAKDVAIRRAIADREILHGVSLEDLKAAAKQEFKENEIFPKSDSVEDWLQLLDIAPENVAAVRPVGRNRGEELARKAIV